MAASTPYSNQGIFGQGAGDLLNYAQSLIDQGVPTDVVTKLLQTSSTPEEMQSGLLQAAASGSFGTGTPNYDPAAVARQQADQAAADRENALNDRFGNDLAWLDPIFQRQATGITPVTPQDALQFGTTADPAAQALQQRAVDQLFQKANAGASGDERYAMDQLGSSIGNLNAIADRGATPDERAALSSQTGAANDLFARARQGATPEEEAALGDQRRVLQTLFGDYGKGASDVELETQGDQRKAIGELFGIYAGGGQNAVAAAQRAQARANQEDWLRGQREADMQNLAERGMAGSGAELASLQADRQAAAGRLSMADLQTQSDLEKSAMDALLNASGVAGQMQQGESTIQARRLQQLLGAGSTAAGITGALGGIENRGTQQLAAGGGLMGDVAQGYGNIETRGLNARLGAAQAANSYGGIAGSVQSRALDALMGAQRGASDMRSASDQYVGANADRLQQAAQFNANMINSAASDNQAFLAKGYGDMLASRNNWDMQTRNLQTDAAQTLFGTDVRDNQYGYGAGFDTAAADTAAANRGQSNYNAEALGAFTGATPNIYDASGAVAGANAAGGAALGQAVDKAGQAVAGYFTGGAYTAAKQAQQQKDLQAAPNMANNPYVRY